jgi:hypothetical protein
MIEPASFFQIFINQLLGHRPELKGINNPEWIRQVALQPDSNGCLKDIILTLIVPPHAKIPAIHYGKIEVIYEHGKISTKKLEVRIRLS